jgi:hypothetical protein
MGYLPWLAGWLVFGVLLNTPCAADTNLAAPPTNIATQAMAMPSTPSYPAPPPVAAAELAARPPAYFALCAIVKDQNADLREWVHYYHWLGAGAIYIYDHGSSTPIQEDLQDWIAAGVVHYSRLVFVNLPQARRQFYLTAQAAAYTKGLSAARARGHQWLAFFDADEFLVNLGRERQDVPSLLRQYEAYGALVVNWRVFGSGGHQTRPKGVSTLEAYTSCVPDGHPANAGNHNSHVKSIVNVPHTVAAGSNPHIFTYAPGFYAVNQQRQRRDGPFSKPDLASTLVLHHYCLRSREEFARKARRGSATGNSKGALYWRNVEGLAVATCLEGVAVGQECCSHAKPGGTGVRQTTER